jgi:hypothetical protein
MLYSNIIPLRLVTFVENQAILLESNLKQRKEKEKMLRMLLMTLVEKTLDSWQKKLILY